MKNLINVMLVIVNSVTMGVKTMLFSQYQQAGRTLDRLTMVGMSHYSRTQ